MLWILERLRSDHANFRRLLDLMEHEMQRFHRAERPDYLLLTDIIEYFQDYPARFHHPAEDLVYLRLKLVAPAIAATITDLEEEHIKEARRLETFSEFVGAVLSDREIPRESVIEAARTFTVHVRTHLNMEEAHFFSKAETHLRNEDWLEIEKALPKETNPHSDFSTLDDLEQIRDHILNRRKGSP